LTATVQVRRFARLGVSVVNALSDCSNLKFNAMARLGTDLQKGKPIELSRPEKRAKQARSHLPSRREHFEKNRFQLRHARHTLRETLLNKGPEITLTDERAKRAEFRFTGGIAEFVKHLIAVRNAPRFSDLMEGKRARRIEIALQYNDS